MSSFYGKRIHDIPVHHLPSLRAGLTIIWLENAFLLSRESQELIDCLYSNCQIYFYTNVSKCLKYLKQTKLYERIIVIIIIDNFSITNADISRLCQYQQLESIFIVSLITNIGKDIDRDISIDSRNKIDKITELFHAYQSLSNRLKELVNGINEVDDDMFKFLYHSEKAFRHLCNELGSYIWSQSLGVVFKSMPYNSSEAKQEMLAECRARYYNDSHKLAAIDDFERNYCSVDAILWYTKPCFLHQIINKALRTGDDLIIYKFRYYIMDLCTHLEKTALPSIDHRQPFRVYRGSKLSRDEVEKLKVGLLVATNSFLSSSKHLDVAQHFISVNPNTGISPSRSRNDECQYIIFEFDVNLMNSPEVVVTDVSSYSSITDENEILFNIGTTFIITSINYDEKHYLWHIRMITSSEVASISQEYKRYTFERCTETTPAISFGHLTCEVFSNYSESVNYLHRLLHSKAWNDDDRPDIYLYLARVYYLMGKYEQTITYCRWVQLLLRRRLPEFNMSYARSLYVLSLIYSEKEDLTGATYFLKRANMIYLKTLPKNCYEFVFTFNQTAYIHWQNEQYEDALHILTHVLPPLSKTLPPSYPCNALTLHIIGLVQHSLNNREQALHYFEESLKMRESFQLIDHPSVARTCYELAVLYMEINDYSTALNYAQRSLSIRKIKLSRSHRELKQSVELVELLSQRYNATLSDQ